MDEMIRSVVLGATLALGLSACAADVREPADLALVNGRVVTVDSAQPTAEAVAVRGGRILAVGSDADIRRYIGPDTRVLDLGGSFVMPAFIEGHGHFMGLGEAQLELDLTTARSWDDIVAMVGRAASEATPGEWILGRGWHQEKWDSVPADAVEGVPTHAALSTVSPLNPVILEHASGHASLVNARAMALAGITRATRAPEGGEILTDALGEPTGLLRENAQRMVSSALSESREGMSEEEKWEHFQRVVRLAATEALSRGITTFHDAGASFRVIDGYRRMAEAGTLPIRLYVMVRGESNQTMAEHLSEYRMIGVGNNHLTVRSIKRQIDGALGSHGAWMLAPYTDMPSSTGLVLEPVEEVKEAAEIAIANDFQVNTHAIGDRANREVLDIYETVMAEHPDRTGLRWRIEHAQHLDPADIPRFASLGVIAAMQGVHATSDFPWVPKRIGDERAHTGAYRWQELWKTGAVVTNGTDTPVEDVNPLNSYWASVSRTLPDGTPFDPDQRLTREQALRSYTINNAYAAFEEDLKGSITPGKLADITVLSKDITTVPETEIREARVLYTILGGDVVYDAASTGATGEASGGA